MLFLISVTLPFIWNAILLPDKTSQYSGVLPSASYAIYYMRGGSASLFLLSQELLKNISLVYANAMLAQYVFLQKKLLTFTNETITYF